MISLYHKYMMIDTTDHYTILKSNFMAYWNVYMLKYVLLNCWNHICIHRPVAIISLFCFHMILTLNGYQTTSLGPAVSIMSGLLSAVKVCIQWFPSNEFDRCGSKMICDMNVS